MYRTASTEIIIQKIYVEVKQLCEKLKQQVNDYIEKFNQNELLPPCLCPRCKKGSEFKFHAIYYRNLLCILFKFKGIPIIRYKCLRCGKTFTDIPEFIEKHRQYAKSIIKFIVKKLSKYTPQELHDILFGIINNELQQTKKDSVEPIPNTSPSSNTTSKKVFSIESITNLAKPQTICITTLYSWKEEFISVYT